MRVWVKKCVLRYAKKRNAHLEVSRNFREAAVGKKAKINLFSVAIRLIFFGTVRSPFLRLGNRLKCPFSFLEREMCKWALLFFLKGLSFKKTWI